MLTRLAPTPSGFLHTGNLVNFVLTARIAREVNAQVWLRIDDADAARVRPEYLDDIFDALDWLELTWDTGPASSAEMPTWSQNQRLAQYVVARESLQQRGHVYACSCSRADWMNYKGQACPKGCVELGVTFVPGETSLRLDVPGMREVVVWRRDDSPAYHLTSVVDDDAAGVDLVVRGVDLAASTEIQRLVSNLLDGSAFHRARVLHHELLVDSAGRKLSKSAGAGAVPTPRTTDVRRAIEDEADRLFDASSDFLRQISES